MMPRSSSIGYEGKRSTAYLRALLEAVVAIVVTFLIAAYVKGRLGV